MLLEEWRPCFGYEAFYEVSSHGRVRSIKHMTHLGPRGGVMRKLFIDRKGYLFLRIYAGPGVEKNERVHVLVARTFLANPENKPTVNHQDGVRSNARLDNLEWATHSEQELHAIAVLNKQPPRSQLGKSGDLHHNSVAVIATFPDGTSRRYASMNLTTADGFSRSGVWKSVTKGSPHRGATWAREINPATESRP